MVSEEKLIRVMDYIRKFSEENGYTPSVREIGKECGIKSTATVHSYLEKLQTKGYLNKATNKKRSVTIGKSNGVSIPLIGTVTAGQPIFAYENYEDYYTFPVGEFRGEDLFMLRVEGTSMIEAGIMNGDKIIVRPSGTEPKVKVYFLAHGDDEQALGEKLNLYIDDVQHKVDTLIS